MKMGSDYLGQNHAQPLNSVENTEPEPKRNPEIWPAEPAQGMYSTSEDVPHSFCTILSGSGYNFQMEVKLTWHRRGAPRPTVKTGSDQVCEMGQNDEQGGPGSEFAISV
jgi:hypothetical protein